MTHLYLALTPCPAFAYHTVKKSLMMHAHFAGGYFGRPLQRPLSLQHSAGPALAGPLPAGASPCCSSSSQGCSCTPEREYRVSDPSCCSCRPGSAGASADSGRPGRNLGTRAASCSKSSEHSASSSSATWSWSRSTSLGSARNAFGSGYLSLGTLIAAWKCLSQQFERIQSILHSPFPKPPACTTH